MDVVDKKTRSNIMRKIKSKNTKFEINFFTFLQDQGYNNLIFHPIDVYGKPDIVHYDAKIAIFLDSCFWHGCPEHLRLPKTNRKYWDTKIKKNKIRDKKVTDKLSNEGWIVMRVWEHSINDELNRENIIKEIKCAINSQH